MAALLLAVSFRPRLSHTTSLYSEAPFRRSDRAADQLAQGVRPSLVFNFDKMVSRIRERAPRWGTSLAPHEYRHGDSSVPARAWTLR
jgi:hypothetical protein